MLMLKKPGGDWKWCSIGQWQWYMTKWVLAPFFPFILLFVKMGSLFNNGEEWQKLDQGGFHLHLLDFLFVRQFNSKMIILDESTVCNPSELVISLTFQREFSDTRFDYTGA